MFSWPADQLLIKKIKIIMKDNTKIELDDIQCIGSNPVKELIELIKSSENITKVIIEKKNI